MEETKPEISQVEEVEQRHHKHHTLEDLAANEDEPQTPYQLGWRTMLALLTLSMGNVCAALSNTTNTTIKFQVATVAKSPADAALASWIANGNFLVILAMGPIFGSLSDRLGKKWFLVGGALLGVVSSVISGSANRITHIFGGNILTGIANAGCIVSISCIQEIMPNKLRPWAMEWAYYFNGIIYGVTALSIALTYFPPSPVLRRHHVLKETASGVDYIGILLMSGSFASLIIGITWGGSTYAWDSGRVIATLVMGCIGLVIFGLYETFVVNEGIMDHRLFQTMNLPILLFVCTIDSMLLLGVNALYAQQIFDLFSQNAVRIAVILSPYLITLTFGCIPVGWITASTRSYRIMLIAALFWCRLMALVNSQRLNWAYAFSALFGIGTAVTTTIPVVALGLSIPSFLIGTAATVSISCRALGGIIGITIFTAIYNNKYASYVGPELVANMHAPVLVAESERAWKYVWTAVACLVAANGVAACFLKGVKPVVGEHGESALEDGRVREQQLA
ncbi:MFS general substrate transporter [Acephala macrosclerotiorum]|nr:MFS general substrate transporter [Acephala macrosclerotiorum]